MSTSFTPQGNLQGVNNNQTPTVLNFYQENIPRGNTINGNVHWRGSYPFYPARLEFGKSGPYTFTTSVNDSVSFQIHGSAIKVIEFDNRTYSDPEIITLLNTELPNTLTELGPNGTLVMRTKIDSSQATIKVVEGNSILGLVSDTTVSGLEQVQGSSPALQLVPDANRQTEMHFWKSLVIVARTDLLFNNSAMIIKSKNFYRLIKPDLFGSPLMSLTSLCNKITGINNVNGKNWIHMTLDLRIPLRVDGTEKDYLLVALVDSSDNFVTDGVSAGELYVNIEGWSIDRSRY